MRINAVIAAAIMAATTSGAALPIPTDITAPALDTKSEPEMFLEDYDGGEVEKRFVDAEAGLKWTPTYRPIGLPDKRDAEADAEAKLKWTPTYRPLGWGSFKRDAEAEAEADAEAKLKWTPSYRPLGWGSFKRDAEAEADAEAKLKWIPSYRPLGWNSFKREADAEAGE
ncbi:hypothetical protein EJ02DRAFT_453100 [Clathrospora elynae]|uniref:Mating factor alpha precursor N-terminal domain-containing protein n=1 Tax=Clathrospora elynae TaxID=706981 RepID=A0A6A5SV68_9PLEO|nr:hypothetical protein EJ02DRAFT_453100 [Clathrospora elynae]